MSQNITCSYRRGWWDSFLEKKHRKIIVLFSFVSVVIENFGDMIHNETTRIKILKTYDGVNHIHKKIFMVNNDF